MVLEEYLWDTLKMTHSGKGQEGERQDRMLGHNQSGSLHRVMRRTYLNHAL